ncbi:MAG: hypothetical protein FWE33_03460 [Defluviitaleaceae bacterium]|nr:hypothetical protein [Defluviitaleaceae bacterium]
MKKIRFLLVSAIVLYILSGCTNRVLRWDYYNEYRFELPFEPISNGRKCGLPYLNTGYSMEQVKGFINEAGYVAKIYQNRDVTTMLISAEKKWVYLLFCSL